MVTKADIRRELYAFNMLTSNVNSAHGWQEPDLECARMVTVLVELVGRKRLSMGQSFVYYLKSDEHIWKVSRYHTRVLDIVCTVLFEARESRVTPHRFHLQLLYTRLREY
jgi:hypothetical protein